MNFIFKSSLYFCIAVCGIINISCNKSEIKPVKPTRGGIALTFDDHNIDNWYKYVNLFDSLDVNATFYISNYGLLTPSQKNKLHDLEKRGHEIAFHSTHHPDFVKYKEKEGSDKLIKEEIHKGLELMRNDGFKPSVFAYPYGKHDAILDNLLIKHFKSVRALNGTHNLYKSLIPLTNNKVIYSLGIDEPSNRSLDKIKGLLYLASQYDQCAVFLIHNIERTDTKYQIPLWKLREILILAKTLNLRFCVISEIS